MAPSAQKARGTQALDDLIMATNSSSIVSKRSVERLYYPDEPHYFRFFVKKFQRRAPLINRGYHLRLKVIDTLVHRFLQKPSLRKKVVVNLGCGSDVLPWQCEVRYPESCRDVTFVDVDYPDLIRKKRQIVLETPELQGLLGSWEVNHDSPVVLKSQRYCQVGCDLRQLETLQRCLDTLFDISNTEFLFVAEVSITYMDTEGADGVISWASAFRHAEFCLLEQILPDGPDHPFAYTMLKHFNKLNTRLKSVHRYPTVASQKERFQSLGWPSTESWTLWETWSDDLFMTAAERRALDTVEAFDEWEEFALFASHYFVMLASTPHPHPEVDGHVSRPLAELSVQSYQSPMSTSVYEAGRGHRRFGAAMLIENPDGQALISHTFGQGPNGRLNSEDLYRISSHSVASSSPRKGPPGRVCHTLTDLGSAGTLLAGGRASPSTAFKDCWLFKKVFNTWERVEDLPSPLFRHFVTRLGSSSLALLAGGKTNHFQTSAEYLLFDPTKGWSKCRTRSAPPSLYGATFVCTGSKGPRTFEGFLIGGNLECGTINQKIHTWKLDLSETEPSLAFEEQMPQDERVLCNLSRFGSIAIQSTNGYVILLGGVIKDVQLPSADDILVLRMTGGHIDVVARLDGTDSSGVVRPFIIGSSVVSYGEGNFAIVGGGATCFSMGTYWAAGSHAFHFDVDLLSPQSDTLLPLPQPEPVRYLATVEITAGNTENAAESWAPVERLAVPRVKIENAEHFQKLLQAGKPVVIEGSDIGPCKSAWSAEYLINNVGSDRKVSVHESTTEKMDFAAKNFRYVTKGFGEFIRQVQDGKRLYLRALSREEPSSLPTQLADDYPSLAKDFALPPQLGFVNKNSFSSVLRISGPVNMWLHYDVMANVYAQVSGSKRLILFPPSDVSYLSFAPGASSSGIDVFSSLDAGSLRGVHPHEAAVGPGDILFLPPLWLHTATPTSDMSVAINVFFRNLERGYSAGRDVYGNRDLAAYEKGRQDIARIGSSFSNLPLDAREFYVRRLADELLQSTTSL
ncbi:leucine carboxyl methyltransferase [Colletotrichum graminicola M1.001]|uniref:tRNA wybutosine-synthesizing protein 4 n=1 Tax=Colletotrichum graminicola (strain M1.001 / M2 / FGSC 10212) TaxID=645133 RepID=E3QRG7_COLGM|nr:leucine carboxyl methyltransferase [Colletotrichum graminicola M1.001]EFQ33455.1 leucine carboxyl methyltransferase [Colletotrichum graminicola M1.001]